MPAGGCSRGPVPPASPTSSPGSSTWCFTSAEDKAWWGDQWAERVVASDLATQAVEGGFATRAELEEVAAGWRAWADSDDGWFSVLHGELLARV